MSAAAAALAAVLVRWHLEHTIATFRSRLTCRHRMFKTDLSLVDTFRKLHREQGWAFVSR
jgi:hypothetical protein